MRQKTLPWTSTVPSLILGLLLGLFAASATATAQSIDFTTNPADEGALGVGYLYNADAVSSDDSEVRYSLRFGPKGMRVDPATGIVRWSPSGLGTVDIEIRAELVDDPSIAGTQSWSVQVGLLDEHPGCVESSTWLTPGGGLPGGSMFAQEVDGKFAVLHETETRTDATHALSIWSNGSWSELNAFNVPFLDTAEIFGMAYFRGDYYLAGSQLTASDPSGSNGGVSRIGDGLEEVGSSNLFHGLAVVTHDDALYVAGYENSDWRELVVKRFDGTSWTSVGTWEQTLRRRANFAVLDGELYLASSDRLSRIEKTSVSEQTVWTEANGVKIVEYDGGLARFASGQDLFVWRPDGGSTTLPSLDFDPNNDADIFEHDGTLYAVEAKRTGGRLDFRRSYEVWYLAGDVWLPVSSLEGPISRINQEFASFAGSLFLLGSLDASCDAPIGNIARLCREGQGDCGRVSGSVYLDANRNCDIDQGEGLERNQTITFEPGGYVARTDETGEFGVLLPVGNYRAGLVPKRHWIATCNDPVAVDITNVATSVTGIAFSTDMIPGIRDMSISVANSPIRTGRPVVYALRYENVGTLPATGTASFTHAPDFTIEEITQEPDRTNGNRLEWDFEDLPVGESVTIKIEMTAPMTIERDDVVCVATDVTFDKGWIDAQSRDDRDTTCSRVVGSYDPNDIRVAPHDPHGEVAYATLYEHDSVLSYTVRFQNTGNDTAFVVVVRDTVDPGLLDIASIELGVASHPFTFDIDGQGFVWTFDNILLPDSTENEPGSHGFFKYRILLNRGLAPNTEIPNRASIYFDFNAPVVTNTVISVTSDVLSVGRDVELSGIARVFPNPIRGAAVLRLASTTTVDLRIRLVTPQGDIISTVHEGPVAEGEHRIDLPVEALPSGTYFVTIEREGARTSVPIVVAR